MEWIFDGIGTELVGLLVGFLLGCPCGYGIKVVINKQNAKDNANQIQIGEIVNEKGKNGE